MSLPLKALDRLWERLVATYGSAFMAKYPGLDVTTVKSVWGDELSGYANRLEPIAWALENLPESPPNAIQFRNICRRMPIPEAPRLPAPKADPERVAAELAKLGQQRQSVIDGRAVGRDWAHKLKDRLARGDRLTAAQLAMMRAALGEEVTA